MAVTGRRVKGRLQPFCAGPKFGHFDLVGGHFDLAAVKALYKVIPRSDANVSLVSEDLISLRPLRDAQMTARRLRLLHE